MRLRSVFVIPLSIASTAALATAVWAQGPRDSALCYKIKPAKSVCSGGSAHGNVCRKDDDCPGGTCTRLPKFVKGITAGISDSLDPNNIQGLDPNSVPGEAFTFDIKKVKGLCAPAMLDGAGFGDENGINGTHWVMYQIKQSKGVCGGDAGRACKKLDDCLACAVAGPCTRFDTKFDKKDPRNTGVRVHDAFNDIRIDFAKEDMLLAPASQSANGYLAPADGQFLKCYKVKPTKAVCTGGPFAGEACKKDVDCTPGFCEKALKFPKETHPDGLSASVIDAFTSVLDPNDPAKTFDVRKVKMFCEAADVKTVHIPLHERTAQGAGLLCYQVKAAKKKCLASSPLNPLGSCKKEENCGGVRRVTSYCTEVDPKFDKKAAAVQGRYVQDEIFSLGHRLNIAKEDLLCVPACRGFRDFEANSLVSRVATLGIGLDGNPGSGVDVDGSPATCAPAGSCSGGVDNQLAAIAGLLNPVLQEELDSGGLNLLFQASALADGETRISGFTGELAATPACAAGDANDPNTYPVDPANPADPCTYIGDASSFFADTRDTCRDRALISLPVLVTGAGTAPSATAVGGGPDATFQLSLPIGDSNVAVTAFGVGVDATLTHDTSDIQQISGALGGAIEHSVLIDSIAGIQDTCFGGANDGGNCEPSIPSSCPAPGSCQLSDSIPFNAAALAGFIQGSFLPDLDLLSSGSCRGGTNMNESCLTVTDCPDQSGGTLCDPRESISIGLPFAASAANVASIE